MQVQHFEQTSDIVSAFHGITREQATPGHETVTFPINFESLKMGIIHKKEIIKCFC